MNALNALQPKIKRLIVWSSTLMLTLILSFLFFGGNTISEENAYLKQAKNSVKADMLYTHPGGH
jgi:hypothetical protein